MEIQHEPQPGSVNNNDNKPYVFSTLDSCTYFHYFFNYLDYKLSPLELGNYCSIIDGWDLQGKYVFGINRLETCF